MIHNRDILLLIICLFLFSLQYQINLIKSEKFTTVNVDGANYNIDVTNNIMTIPGQINFNGPVYIKNNNNLWFSTFNNSSQAGAVYNTSNYYWGIGLYWPDHKSGIYDFNNTIRDNGQRYFYMGRDDGIIHTNAKLDIPRTSPFTVDGSISFATFNSAGYNYANSTDATINNQVSIYANSANSQYNTKNDPWYLSNYSNTAGIYWPDELMNIDDSRAYMGELFRQNTQRQNCRDSTDGRSKNNDAARIIVNGTNAPGEISCNKKFNFPRTNGFTIDGYLNINDSYNLAYARFPKGSGCITLYTNAGSDAITFQFLSNYRWYETGNTGDNNGIHPNNYTTQKNDSDRKINNVWGDWTGDGNTSFRPIRNVSLRGSHWLEINNSKKTYKDLSMLYTSNFQTDSLYLDNNNVIRWKGYASWIGIKGVFDNNWSDSNSTGTSLDDNRNTGHFDFRTENNVWCNINCRGISCQDGQFCGLTATWMSVSYNNQDLWLVNNYYDHTYGSKANWNFTELHCKGIRFRGYNKDNNSIRDTYMYYWLWNDNDCDRSVIRCDSWFHCNQIKLDSGNYIVWNSSNKYGGIVYYYDDNTPSIYFQNQSQNSNRANCYARTFNASSGWDAAGINSDVVHTEHIWSSNLYICDSMDNCKNNNANGNLYCQTIRTNGNIDAQNNSIYANDYYCKKRENWLGNMIQDIRNNCPCASDYRIKTNIQRPNNVLDRLCAIPLITYQYKETKLDHDTNVVNIGTYAHYLKDSFPEITSLVKEEKDAVDENNEIKVQEINMYNMNFILMKAIQEQNEIIKNLQLL